MTNSNYTYSILFATFVLSYLFSQHQSNADFEYLNSNTGEHCGTTIINDQYFDSNPEIEKRHDQLEKEIYNYLQNNSSSNNLMPNYTLPIVIHIIHDNGVENISDAAVLQGIQHLNESFTNTGYYDQGTGVNTEIEFCLAERDPEGNTTTGITRDVNPLTELVLETEDIAMKDINRWDPMDYINIWVVREICSNSVGCGVAGYAYFPSSHGGNNDGIVVEANWFGSSNGNSTVLSHEMGHYLGLYHTFEGGCTNNNCLTDGDRVCDTPPDQSTAAVPCNASPNSCTNDVNASDPNNPFTSDQGDMFWNYMDYGDWDCYSAFTAGQSSRMEFFITGARASLLTSEACLPACMSSITASFNSSSNPVNVGLNVSFNNTSTGGTTYEWLIDGVPFSNGVNMIYNFPAEGFYVITLNVTNGDSNCFETYSETIQVVCPVVADFTATPIIAGINELVTLTNNSINGLAYEWFLNGASQGTSTDFSFSVTNPAVVQVCLEATGAVCSDTHCEFISIISNTAGDCDLTYIKTLGNTQVSDGANVIVPASDGDFFIAGNRADSALLMKVSPSGEPIWARTFKMTSSSDQIYDMILDSDDNLVAVGYGTNTAGNSDCFAFKYDYINDNVIWNRLMPQPDMSRFWGIVEKASGDNYIITGQVAPANNPGSGCDAFVMELERTAGTVQWMRNYQLGSCESAVDVVIDGNTILITGRFNNAGGGTAEMRGSLTRLDFSGNELWSRLYLIPTTLTARIYSTEVLIDGTNIISASHGDDNGTNTADNELHLYATDPDGNIQWAEKIDIPGADTERSFGLVNLADGYLLYGHYTQSNQQLFLLKTNKQGQLLWSKNYGSPSADESAASIMVQDGFIYLLGKRGTNTNQDIYLAKLNMEGELAEDCDEIGVLQTNQTTYTNPYDGLHPLVVFDPNLTTNTSPGETAQATSIAESEICSAEDCCTTNTFVQTIGNTSVNEGGSNVIPSGDGNLFVAGTANNQALIMKVNPIGEPIWSRTFDIVNGYDRVNHLLLDSENNLVASGHDSNNESNPRGFVFKYDYQNDALLWSKRLSSGTRVRKVLEPSPGGDYVILGDLFNPPPPGNQPDLVMLSIDRNSGDLSGNITNNYNHQFVDNPVSGMDYQNAIYMAGRYMVTSSTTTGQRAAFSKFDLNGNHLFSRTLNLNPSGGASRTYIRDIIGDEGFVISCISGDDDGSSSTNTNFFLSKHTTDGDLVWVQKYDITAYQNEWAEEVIATPDGYLLYGNNRSGELDIFLAKTDKDGNLQWVKSYGETGDETTYFSYQNTVTEFDNQYYVVSHTTSPVGSGEDIIFIKTDLNGDVEEGCGWTGDLIGTSELVINPSNDAADLITYNSPVSLSDINAAPAIIDLNFEIACEASCLEICNNGIDDDADGLVDFYDPDCPCADSLVCGSPFYNNCQPECEYPIPAVPFEMENIWSRTGIRSGNISMVADINGDCTPDVVAVNQTGLAIEVLNSATGQTMYDFPVSIPVNYTQLALGDVDNDGMAEIFYVESFFGNGSIVRLDFIPGTGALVATWTTVSVNSSSNVPGNNFSPGLADFDYNGVPEVYIGNQIFNSETGTKLADGQIDNQGTYVIGSSNFMTSTSVAVDVLPDSECLFCQGLELVAGGQVYTVNIASYTTPALNDISVEKELVSPDGSIRDGATRLVDFDRDGDLDVVVTTQNTAFGGARIFIWDILTETLIGNEFTGLPNPSSERIGPASIGDVDNDGWPEIVVATSLNFNVLEDYQNGGMTNWGSGPATIKASITTTDQSGGTGASIYDLNGDGAMEIIYRDEQELRVFDGDLNELSSIDCTSGTALEYPVIADINGDGETEFLCGCDNIGLTAFRSANLPWIKARKIWNQFNYFVSNVYDDSSIPIQQQNPHLVGDGVIMNGFLVQQPILDEEGTPINPAPDAELTIDSAFCINDSVNVFLTICNDGDFPLTELTPVSVYFGDPTSSVPSLVATFNLGINLEVDSCTSLVYPIANAINESIFVVVNDDGSGNFPYDLENDFPVTSIGECDFEDNIDDTEVQGDVPPVLELGPDIIVCENGVFEFNAGGGFDNYEWHDGATDSTYTAWAPGTFWVTAWNDCGERQSDTIQVSVDSITILDLGLDTVLCGGGSITLSIPGYDRYEWFPNQSIDCDSCGTVIIDPDTTMTYTLVASSDLGCISVDSIQIIIADTFYTEIDTSICEGETFTYDGQELEVNTSTLFTFSSVDDCDSTILVNVNSNGLESFYIEVDTSACLGSEVLIDGVSIPTDSTHLFEYTSISGCDSVIAVTVASLDTFYTVENQSICEGETILIFGNEVSVAGDYSMTFSTIEGCDSTIVIALEVFDAPEISLSGLPSCVNDSTGSITATIIGGTGPFTYDWSVPGADNDLIENLPVGTYSLTVSDANNCIDTASIVISDVSEVPVSGITIDVSCFGESDGAYLIDTTFTGYLFSLDGIIYQNSFAFNTLTAGTYELYIQDPNGCDYVQSFSIAEPPELLVLLPPDTTIQLGCSISIEPYINRFDTLVYQWSPPDALSCLDCPDPIADPVQTTTYTLVVTDSSGCVSIDEILIEVDKRRRVFIPNVFSPNFDGTNDVFYIQAGKGVAEVRTFVVYDRWGEQMFEARNFQPNDPLFGWDGTFKNKDMNPGVFVYYAEVIFVDGEIRNYKGSVTLVK